VIRKFEVFSSVGYRD